MSDGGQIVNVKYTPLGNSSNAVAHDASVVPGAPVDPVAPGASASVPSTVIDMTKTVSDNQKAQVYVGDLIPLHHLSLALLILVILIIWFFTGLQSPNKKDYFIVSGVIFGIILLITILAGIGFKLSWIFSAATFGLFIWFVWDTYKTYKDSGQEGMANTQVMLMVSILATIVIAKLVLSSSDGSTEGFPQLIAIFMTVVSFNILYLIENLSQQACDVPKSFHIMPYIMHGALFFIIYTVRSYNPFMALAICVAAFAYFSFSAKFTGSLEDIKEAEKTGKGKKSDSTDIGITMFLMILCVLKILFPTITIGSIENSKIVVTLMHYFTLMAILSFIIVNIMYTARASVNAIVSILTTVAIIVGIIMIFGAIGSNKNANTMAMSAGNSS